MEKRILLIDDDPAVQQSFRYALAGEDYRLAITGSGTEGLAAARREPPDLVFLDLRMTDMDGVDVLRELRASLTEIPIYIITAYRGDYLGALRRAREGGLHFDVADKPLSDMQIRQIAAGFLHNARLILFFAGERQKAEQNAERLRRAFDRRNISAQVVLVDVLEAFESAVQHGVFATPMLLRLAPEPQRRVVGDLTEPEKVLRKLGFANAGEYAL